LDVYNVFTKQAKATKLGDFIWEQFDEVNPCLFSLMLPWQPLFDKLFFRILNFPLFNKKSFLF